MYLLTTNSPPQGNGRNVLHLDCHAEAFRHKKRTPQFCGVLLYKLLKSLISAVLFLFLRTSGNQSFTGSISFVFSKVLDESVSQIFCFCFPFGSISVCVTWVQDSWINAWQFCRNFEVEVWNGLCRSILDISVQDSIDDTTSILDGDTFACSVPSCIYQVCFCTALLHFLNQFFCIFCRMQLQECLAEAS